MVNIFAVDEDPVKAAISLCDKHIVKMSIESLQMLSSIHRICDGIEVPRINSALLGWKDVVKHYKKSRSVHILPHFGEKIIDDDLDDIRVIYQVYLMAHRNHPCTIWARTNSSNYMWLSDHTDVLFAEYTRRYGKIHNSYRIYSKFLQAPPRNIPNGPQTPFALAMKNFPQCVVEDDPVQSYRNYYNLKRSLLKHPMKWKNRTPPTWFKGYTI